jgi:hypothetical protein
MASDLDDLIDRHTGMTPFESGLIALVDPAFGLMLTRTVACAEAVLQSATLVIRPIVAAQRVRPVITASPPSSVMS